MREPQGAAADWASMRRRRWSGSRISAALALHLLLLMSLKLAIDRVQMPRHDTDRVTTLVMVAVHAAPPPPLHPAQPTPAAAPARRPRATPAVPRPREDATQAITLPAPRVDAASPVSAAAPPASAPQPDLSFLDNAGTRQAIRDAARGGPTLAGRANAITRVDPTAGERLAQGIDAAHKGDCMKGEYLGGGMGLLSTPFLLAAEALGNCSSK